MNPNNPPMTFEQAMAILKEQHANTLAQIEIDKKLHQEAMEKKDEEIKLFKEEMKEWKEQQKKSDEEWKERMEQHDEYMKKSDERMENLSRRFGNLTNRFGEIVEGLVSPNLCIKFRKYGFNFGNTATRYEISNGKKVITDIDVLLEDGDSVMAVEVKTKPTIDDINRHIWRMEQIQNYPPGATRGRKVYGAIACAIIDEDVKEAAFNSGFYVICQTGDNVEILPTPDSFVAKCWEVDDTNLKK